MAERDQNATVAVDKNDPASELIPITAAGVDEEVRAGNERTLASWQGWLFFTLAAGYTAFHLITLNVRPLEFWTFRIIHVAGALVLGYAFIAAYGFDRGTVVKSRAVEWLLTGLAGIGIGLAAVMVGFMYVDFTRAGEALAPTHWTMDFYAWPLVAGIAVAIVTSWLCRGPQHRMLAADWLLALAAIVVCVYLLTILDRHRFTNGTSFAPLPDVLTSVAGILLIIELTRRVTGLALIVIAAIFVGYAFVGPWLPGFLSHNGFDPTQTFTYLYSDKGILGPTTAVSSTYIILFIVFAAFLQASKVGEYFVNFTFALAGRARGGPAKVAVFSSGLMGMINGTSAGNVVATGSLTIPLMKKVGYRSQSAGAIEAAASTGGQIMPPIMGAGAFIMAEITGIPYTDLVVAAIIPAALYFASIYFNVDFEARRMNMRGLRREELPSMALLLRRVYMFAPIIFLIVSLFMGYTVIRAGTIAIMAAAVISWLTPFRLGPFGIAKALEIGARMSIQIIAVCACAGLIVGVIALTGVGARFSSLLLRVAESPYLPDEIGMLMAMIFAMAISIILGMGMPTTAAYAIAASVVAPGLIDLGIQPLVAHFFVFYFAVISAITPPVALASYAAAGIANSDPMRTSVTSFKFGLAAFIVPFMFFYNDGMLVFTYVDGERVLADWQDIAHVAITASVGVYLLSASVQGWYLGRVTGALRLALLIGALALISGGWITDLVGIGLAVVVGVIQRLAAQARAQPAE